MKTVDVAAAIIEKGGKFLIAKRKAGRHLSGKWEFPGGKIEQGETPEACLERELREEFGIETETLGFVAESVFDYGEKKIRLLGYRSHYISGEFELNDHDEVQWIDITDFNRYDFAEADLPLIKALQS